MSCGGATDGGSACEATGRTENRKWSILTMLRLNYLREQHLRKVNIQVSSFRQDIFKMYLQKHAANTRFTMPPTRLLPHSTLVHIRRESKIF